MPNLLDVLYILLLIAASPFLALKAWKQRKYREGWAEKLLGRAPERVGQDPCIWFHAVSVGEVLALRPVITGLSRRHPDWQVVLSTTTETGLEVARKTFPDQITFFAPLDFSWSVRNAIRRIRPTVLAMVELELWPNWLEAARRAGARVVVLNGRLGAKSYRGYRKIRYWLAPRLRRVDLFAVQSEEYARRFEGLGAIADRVSVTGSVKYDGLEFDRSNAKTIGLRRRLGLSTSEVVFVAGSTMEGEELAAWDAYSRALADHPRLRLIVVPRHPERADAVERSLVERGARVDRLSRMTAERPDSIARAGTGGASVLLVDVLGELGAVWGLSDIAFVGGSLYPGRNGQNMMEPAAFGSAVLFGPYTSNFREATEGLLSVKAARRVANAEDLAVAVLEALDEPEAAEARGEAARRFVHEQQGATERTLALLDRVLGDQPPRKDRHADVRRNSLAASFLG